MIAKHRAGVFVSSLLVTRQGCQQRVLTWRGSNFAAGKGCCLGGEQRAETQI